MVCLLTQRLSFWLAVPLVVVSLGACGDDDDGGGGAAGTTSSGGASSLFGGTGGTTHDGGASPGTAGASPSGHPGAAGTGGSGVAGASTTATGGTSPSAGGSSSGATGGGTASNDADQYCVDTINGYRATLGLPALARWADGEVCADGEAKSDAETQKPHGFFGTCGESAQDECPGWPGPEKDLVDGCLKMMWDEGPGDDYAKHGHYINMSNKNYTEVACGFFQVVGGSYWAVQNFR